MSIVRVKILSSQLVAYNYAAIGMQIEYELEEKGKSVSKGKMEISLTDIVMQILGISRNDDKAIIEGIFLSLAKDTIQNRFNQSSLEQDMKVPYSSADIAISSGRNWREINRNELLDYSFESEIF